MLNVIVLVSQFNLVSAETTGTIIIPKLEKDESYTIELCDQVTCVELEKMLEVPAGSITTLEQENGILKISLIKNYPVDTNLLDKIAEKTGKYVQEITKKR